VTDDVTDWPLQNKFFAALVLAASNITFQKFDTNMNSNYLFVFVVDL